MTYGLHNRAKVIVIALSLILFFMGCGRPNYPELSDNYQVFTEAEFTDGEMEYISIEYEGRTYIPYGTVKSVIYEKDIDECIGCRERDGEPYEDERYYTLVADKEHNYIMDYYVGTTLMNTPLFLRAIDTKGVETDTPAFIESLGYEYWN